MAHLKALLNTPYFIWVILALPSIPLLIQFLTGVYDGLGLSEQEVLEIRERAGTFAAISLALALLMTPLSQLRNSAFLRWLLARRRYFGVACFSFAVLHMALYLVILESAANFVQELGRLEIILGWLAFFIIVPLGLTSNQVSMRILGRKWKRLQQFAYLVGLLVLAHWLLVHGPMPALVFFAPLALLEAIRLWRNWRRSRLRRSDAVAAS